MIRMYHWKIPGIMDFIVSAGSEDEGRMLAMREARQWLSMDNMRYKVIIDTLAGPPLLIADPGFVITINEPIR